LECARFSPTAEEATCADHKTCGNGNSLICESTPTGLPLVCIPLRYGLDLVETEPPSDMPVQNDVDFADTQPSSDIDAFILVAIVCALKIDAQQMEEADDVAEPQRVNQAEEYVEQAV